MPGHLEMIASSERGIVDGVEVFLHAANAGERFAVRVGTLGDAEGREFTLNWEDDEPVWLRYLGRTDEHYEFDDADGERDEVTGFRSLAVDSSGRALYVDGDKGIAVFERNGNDGALAFKDVIEAGSRRALFWDDPRNRLLALDGCAVRSYAPVDGNVSVLEDEGAVSVSGNPACAYGDRRVFAHPSGRFLYLLEDRSNLQVFSFAEDGALIHVQEIVNGAIQGATISNAGDHAYGVGIDGILRVFASADTGELTEVASLPLQYAHEAVAVTDDDSRVFAWGRGGSSVVDVDDPTRPVLLDTVALPQEVSWWTPNCLAAAVRIGRSAGDAFCTNGDAYALAWRDGELAVTDLAANWSPNRYNELVPDFGRWTPYYGFAASPDGRHAYFTTPRHGILVFERIGNGDDQMPNTAAVTIAADASEVTEGTPADFTLTRSDSVGALTVNVEVTETEAMIDGTAPTTVTFADGAATAVLSVATEDDAFHEPDSVVTASVEAGTGYAPGSPDSATVTVVDDDSPDPAPIVFAHQTDITTDAVGAVSVYAVDLDGDGDADVLTASIRDDKIAWHENEGDGEFSAQRVITTDANGASSVHAADLDGDGDADVLTASRDDDKVAWHENEGGGEFSAQRVITTDADGAVSVHAADLDGDGDADVLTASRDGPKVAWHENEGDGTFSAQRVISALSDGTGGSVHASDMDGDGDPDVVLSSQTRVAWHENEGGGRFSALREITTDDQPLAVAGSVYAADLDLDGDPDILTSSRNDGKIGWHENLGAGEFSAEHEITTAASGARFVHAADLDGDGDPDVLSASEIDHKIAWYENQGGGAFSSQHVIASTVRGAQAVYAVDLDGDGDPDVLSASLHDNAVAWYENLSDHGDDHEDVTDATATLTTVLPAFLHGTLESGGDRDVFRFATGSGTLRVYSNGPTDTYGTLLTADGGQLANDDDSGESTNFAIDAEVAAGVHYVEVRHYSSTGTGAYTLSVEFVLADDHGSTPEASTPVASLPGSARGELEREGDRDVFRVDLDEPGTLTAYTTGGTDTVGKLTDAGGDLIAEDGDSRDGSNFEIEAAVEEGTHYIEVSGFADEGTGPYTLFIEFVASPEGLFAAQRVISTDVDAPFAVHAADLDGDGDADLLSGSRDDKIAWYENLGAGAFSVQRVITTEVDGPDSVYAADLDGDGDPDVLSASFGDDKIAWHENLGGGAFSTQHVITTDADMANSVHAADLDGDGDADVLSSSQLDDKIAWYENLGGGRFSTQQIITTDADRALFVHGADLDGDGDADVLSASFGDDKIAWYENLGGGEFSAQRVITTDADGARRVRAGDMDGDGDVDVLTTTVVDIAWYENVGNGVFQRVATTEVDGAISVHGADLDGDRDQDVLSARQSDDEIAWYENLGGGAFSERRVITTDAESANSVYAADLDNDGDPDVLSASGLDDKIAWYENLSDHGDDHGDVIREATLATTLPAFLHGTLESGGDRDVFRFTTGSGLLRVYSHGPTNTFGTLLDADGGQLSRDDDAGSGANFEIETSVSTGVHYVEVRHFSTTGTGAYTLSIEFVADTPVVFSAERVITRAANSAWSVYAADLDGDADVDVLSASNGDDKIAWHENRGEGVFSTQRVITRAADGAWSVYAADLDGDGDADVLSASDADDKVAWHENLGGGSFSTQRVLTTDARGARSVHAADLDGDGDADVLSASYTSGQVAWHENLGGGSFSAQRVVTTARGALSVHAADLDGDGDADVLSASSINDTIAWQENLGGGRFSAQRDITTDADNASFVYAADLDGDGDADVLSASILDDKVAWYENLGGGTFSAQRAVTTGADHAWSVHAADLDGDRDSDLLSASRLDDKIAWYANLGNGTFSAQRVITTATDGAQSVYAADLDGDGDPDVLSASYLDHKIAWYENQSNHGDDHGNTPAAATLATALPALLNGTLESSGDRDVFRFATGSGTLRAYSNGPTDTFGSLRDADGDQLRTNDDGGVGVNFRIATNVTAGVYYVEVRGYADTTGPYTLSIELVAD